MWLQPLRSFQVLPAHEDERKDPNHHVLEQKVRHIEVVVDENAVAGSKSNNEASN